MIIGALCAAALVLAGCSALRLGYGQAPNLAYWWLDAYADFDVIQKPKVRAALDDWFAWHRRTQLADYARVLAQAQTEAVADTTPQRACAWWDDLSRRVDVAAEPAIVAAAPLVLTLSPAQINHIEQHYAEVNADYRDEYLQPDPAARLEASVDRVVKRTESLYGPVTDAQRARIAGLVAQSPFDPELWFAERRQRQQDALQMLRTLVRDRASREQAEAALRTYVRSLKQSPRENYRRYNDRLVEANCAFTAAVHNGMSAAQRQVAVQKLKGWEADLRVLAADAS